ncbi:MAG: oligosaccharide flippase family protein, partial [Gammaproteobacteria bacterium]|nr:oligosaccharide flippase family protein [Gammaproteobacteria bacterium]
VGILLARSLGPENYGIYAFLFSVIILMGLPTRAGLPTLVVRETAKNQLKERWGYLRGLLTLANGFVIGFSILAALMTAVLVLWLWGDQEGVKSSALLWALWLLPLIAFGNIRGATLRGLRKVVSGLLPEKLVRPLMMMVLLSGAMLLGVQMTPVVAMQYNVIAALVGFMLGAVLLMRAMPKEVRRANSEYETKAWAASLLPLSLFSGMKIADSQLTIVILGTLGTIEEVGLFRVAAQGAALVAFGITAINLVLSPHVARLYHSGDIVRLQKMITNITRMAFVVSLPIALIFIVWGEVLIGWIFGVEYTAAATALAIMSLGQLMNVSVGSVAVILNMAGFERESLKGIAVALGLNVLSALILVPTFGLNGAAVGVVISLAAWNLILMLATYKKVGIYTFAFSLTRKWRR